MKSIRVLSMPLLAAVALAGCVSQPLQRAPQAPVDPASARAQDGQRAALTQWSLSGRIALSNGKQGGSGRIDWQQAGDSYTVSLSAPVTRQSWRLIGDQHGARLEGIEGGPRESDDVESMLRETTGWNVPVRALAAWVRGVAADPTRFGAADIAYGDGDRPVRLSQAGWAIDYTQWQDASVDADAPLLPTRLNAIQGSAKVRLIVDEWTPGAMP